jgi:hypothetical protein
VVSNLKVRHVLTDSDDNAGNFVAWNHGKDSGAPFLSGLMNVRVADTSETYFDVDIVVTDSTTGNFVGHDRSFCNERSISLSFESGSDHLRF